MPSLHVRAPIDRSNAPRDPDAVASVDDLLDASGEVGPRPQGVAGRYDADGWYTPPSTPPDAADGRDAGPPRVPLVATLCAGLAAVAVLLASTSAVGAAPTADEPALAPFVVATLVSDGFARLEHDRVGAATAFRRALASDPDHGPARLGLGLASLRADPALAATSLCAAAAQGGVVGASARDALDAHGLRCDPTR